MLQPKQQKYRKQFRGTMRGVSQRGSQVNFGDWGLKALGRGWLTARQLEAARRSLVHYTKRAGKIWIRIFPDKPVTKKAAGQTMGSGKGEIDHYVAVVRPGKILFEMGGIPPIQAKTALQRAGHKLPFKSAVIAKE